MVKVIMKIFFQNKICIIDTHIIFSSINRSVFSIRNKQLINAYAFII